MRHRGITRWWWSIGRIPTGVAAGVSIIVASVILGVTAHRSSEDANHATEKATSLADPILVLCRAGGDTAQRLTDAGLCTQAASVKTSSSDSLKGDKGDRGERGPQGAPGVDGKDGENGKDGSPATSMTLNGSGFVYTCRRSGGANTAPVYSCPGLGGVQPGFQAPMPFPQQRFNPRPRSWTAPHGTH